MDKDERINEIIKELRKIHITQKKLLDELNNLREDKDNNESTSILNSPEEVPKKIRKLLNLKKGDLVSRSKIIQLFYEYLKENELIHKKTKDIILNDEIKNTFGMKNNDKMNFYNIQSWIRKVYDNEAN